MAGACSDDDAGDTTTSSPGTASTTSTTAPPSAAGDDDPEGTLDAFLLDAAALPEGFEATADEVDDTITAFCAGEDATAGLRASARAVLGFTRTPPGASVIQLVFRFEDDGAARFVAAAEAILARCSDVPDATGLAFTYEPAAPEVVAALDGADAVASRYGTSVGSGNLTIDVAVLHHGDVGQLVAVLGLELPRAELDALATTAFQAAADRAEAAAG